MVRMGLSASLNAEPDMEVVAEVGNGQAALDAYSQPVRTWSSWTCACPA
jgi:DNA-binding NarL/FixJ family response regulator